MTPPRRTWAFLILTLLTGCTAQTTTPRAPSATAPSQPSIAFAGPVARPAEEARVINSRIRVAVAPIGAVPYDGQVLPILSPDGKYLATQVGEAPLWPALLATPAQAVALRTRVEIYDISQSPPRRVPLTSPVPRGTMLGRSADSSGVIVERVLPDGGRTVARMNWLTGELTTLSTTQAGASSAHHALSPTGATAWTLRATPLEPDALALTTRNSAPATRSAETVGLAFPAFLGPDRIIALERSTSGVDITAYLVEQGATQASPPELTLLARRKLLNDPSMTACYQAMATAPHQAAHGNLGAPPALLFFHPGAKRMALFDPTTGGITLLTPNSIAADWARPTTGGWALFLTTPDGMKYQPVYRDDGVLEALPAVPVVKEVYAPRATTDPQRPFILIGPSHDRPNTLQLVAMRIEPDN